MAISTPIFAVLHTNGKSLYRYQATTRISTGYCQPIFKQISKSIKNQLPGPYASLGPYFANTSAPVMLAVRFANA